jgi:hypothetical protein
MLEDPVSHSFLQEGGTVHGRQSFKRGQNDDLHTSSFGWRFEGFFTINNLAMRDFGLLESGCEDNKGLIPVFISIMLSHGSCCRQWQLRIWVCQGDRLARLATMELGPLLARLSRRSHKWRRSLSSNDIPLLFLRFLSVFSFSLLFFQRFLKFRCFFEGFLYFHSIP